MFDRILIPVDGTEASKQGAKLGFNLAKIFNASVDLLHAVEGKTEKAEEKGENILKEAAELSTDEVNVEKFLVESSPHKAIKQHVEKYDIELTVMGRKGRKGLEDHLLGSSTERVLRESDIPVLVVSGRSDSTNFKDRDVLITTDGSDAAETAASYGARIAHEYGVELHLLNVVDVQAESGIFDAGGVSDEFIDRLEKEGRKAVDSLVQAIDENRESNEEKYKSSVVKGMPYDEIRSYVNENKIGLIVMSSQGKTSLAEQHLGSTTSRVIRTVQTPVLIVP